MVVFAREVWSCISGIVFPSNLISIYYVSASMNTESRNSPQAFFKFKLFSFLLMAWIFLISFNDPFTLLIKYWQAFRNLVPIRVDETLQYVGSLIILKANSARLDGQIEVQPTVLQPFDAPDPDSHMLARLYLLHDHLDELLTAEALVKEEVLQDRKDCGLMLFGKTTA